MRITVDMQHRAKIDELSKQFWSSNPKVAANYLIGLGLVAHSQMKGAQIQPEAKASDEFDLGDFDLFDR